MNKVLKSLALGCCLLAFSAFQVNASETAAQKPSPDEIIKMLKEGNQRFVSGKASG